MPETRASGVCIAYDDAGRGEPALLFLPGWCHGRRAFRELVARCAARRRVLALDWRGHGDSESPSRDFGAADLVDDALAVIEASGARRIVPVSLSHAGWVAIELRRRLGARVEKIALLDWTVGDPPPTFLRALAGLQAPATSAATREAMFSMWLAGSADPRIVELVRSDMASYGAVMWGRAAREIAAAYAKSGSPLAALAALAPAAPVLHAYAQPEDPGYLAMQHAFAARHSWFQVRKLAGRTHFPILEVPDEVAGALEAFIG